MGQAVSSLSLNLRYEGLEVPRSALWRYLYEDQTDFDGILNQLREAENVEEIKFLTSGVGEQDNENICKIIKKILTKPNLNKITYDIEDELGDFNGMEIDGEFPQNLTVKKLDINVTDFTSWTWQQLLLATPNVEEIDILAFDSFIELPQLIRNVKVLKKLKIINVVINAGCYNDPVPNASQEERAVALEETRKVLKDELPISIKASVKELMDDDDEQILIEKEANEEPRLI